MPHHTDVQRDCPPQEARSVEAAALRGQKLILSLSRLTHKLQTLIKRVRSEQAGAARRALRMALWFQKRLICGQKPLLPLIKL